MGAPAAIATDRSPSFSLPLRFFLLGCAALVAALGGVGLAAPELASGTPWSPALLALTHLFALGFMLSMIMGAAYQLVPVVLFATIRHEALGKLGFWPYAGGVAAMVAGFWSWTPALLAVGGTLVALGFGIFLLTLALSLARGAEWSEVGGAFLASLGAMLAAVTVGLVRLLGFVAPERVPAIPNALSAHASLATLGCASLLIYGVSYRLVPMFAVGHESLGLARPVLLLGGLGVGAIAAGSLAQVPLAVGLGMGAAAIGAGLWAIDARRMFRTRARRRLDAGMTYAAVAVAYLLVALGMGLALAWGAVPPGVSTGRWAIAFAVVGLVGWIGFSIVGYFHKILPFLAWYHRYSGLVGKRKVPLIRDLFDERSTWVGFWASQLGLGLLAASLLVGNGPGIGVAGGLLLLGALATARVVWECLTR